MYEERSIKELEDLFRQYSLPLPDMTRYRRYLNMDFWSWIDQSWGDEQNWIDHGSPTQQQWFDSQYRTVLVTTLGNRAEIIGRGGPVPGQPGFLVPWPEEIVKVTNGFIPPPEINGYAPGPPPKLGDYDVIRTGSPAPGGTGSDLSATIISILTSMGFSSGMIATWLPKVLALIATGVAVYTAIQMITKASPRVPGTELQGPILQGPGVPEPREGTYYKTWHTKYERRDGRDGLVYFWLLNDGRIISWDNQTGRSKIWRPKKPVAVIMSGGKTSLATAVRAQRHLDRLWRTVAKRTKQLKLA